MKFKILVLLATFNGDNWLKEQLESILNQSEIDLTLIISDDDSIDGTILILESYILKYSNIKLLPKSESVFGSAGKNFYRLINDVDISGFDYVAFADQDDIWEPIKLIKHVNLIKKHHAEGVSSTVIAFWPNGNVRLLDKANPQRCLDYLFESAGPGCTFLMAPWLVRKIKESLQDDYSPAKSVALHDWLAYAICRANGRCWVIDPEPSVMYRQHDTNVIGANVGFKAKIARLSKLKNNWYRNEVIKIAEVCQKNLFNPKVDELLYLLQHKSIATQLKLLKIVPEARRRLFDRFMLASAILLGLF